MEMIKLCEPDIDQREYSVIKKVLESGWLAHGEYNKRFESEFAEYIGTEYAITLNSCTSALELALLAQDIKGEVILPSFTWNASANSIVTTGGTPVFVDVNYDDCNINTDLIEEKVTDKTEAIMPVHYAGQACDMDEIIRIAEKHNLKIIEDSAETIGGEYKNKKTGNFGIGCFSFFPTKNMTTCEGGMITTNDSKLAKKIKSLSSHGVSSHTIERENKKYAWYRDAHYPGYNYRMPNILAAMGCVQLSKLDEMNSKRREIANRYNSSFSNIDKIAIPHESSNCTHVYQMYTIKIKDSNYSERDKFVSHLRAEGIEASVHFSPPVHLQTYYKTTHKLDNLPVTKLLSDTIVSLPIHSRMSIEDTNRVVSTVKRYFETIFNE